MKTVTTSQIRQLDQQTIAAGVPGELLMERAGFAVARAAFDHFKQANSRTALLLAGKGNNGGDAFVAARHLAGAGCHPILALFCRRHDLKGDALAHFQKMGQGVTLIENATLDDLREIMAEHAPSVVVDGLLGTGLTGDLREPLSGVIRWVNTLGVAIVAIDIPSGLDSDTGVVHGVCVRADVTVTMALPKIGLLCGDAPEYVGRIEVADIGFQQALMDAVETDVELLTPPDVAPLFPARRRTSHKGDYGHLLVIAGSEGYTGAPVLTAHAAARMGAGLVTLAVPREIYPIVAAMCPAEVMPRVLDDGTAWDGYDAVAMGPGMGQMEAVREMICEVLAKLKVPAVVDADALNAISWDVGVLGKATVPLVLTPHPGEMGRLAGKSAKEVQTDRWGMAREFAREHKVTLVLKGAGSVVTDPSGKLWINSTGNPGMAKGGMGDVLTGMIGALLARGMNPLDAARAGVFLHGSAGDLARDRLGEESMQASDLIGMIGEAVRSLKSA